MLPTFILRTLPFPHGNSDTPPPIIHHLLMQMGNSI